MSAEPRVVIVTGAGGGIGRAMVSAFAASGGQVVAADIDETRAAAAAETAGSDAVALPVDVTAAASVEALVAETVRRFGRLDVMINNAGVENEVLDILDLPVEEYLRTVAVNQHGCFYGIRAAAAAMRDRGGVIVNTASVYGVLAARGQVPYVASKAAVIGLTRAAARDLARYQIRVVAIAPGLIDTNLSRTMLADERAWEAIERGHLRRQAGRPEDVAALAVFLASEEARFLNGHIYFVDDGYATFKP